MMWAASAVGLAWVGVGGECYMSSLGGGGVAAYGLYYQYLVTAEFFLRFLRQNPELIARAGPPRGGTSAAQA